MRHNTTHSRMMNIQNRIVFAAELEFTTYLTLIRMPFAVLSCLCRARSVPKRNPSATQRS